MTSKHCEECGNFINCKYYLKCSGDASHASDCPGYIIEKEFKKINIDLYKVKKFEGVASEPKNPKQQKLQTGKNAKRVENRLPFLL